MTPHVEAHLITFERNTAFVCSFLHPAPYSDIGEILSVEVGSKEHEYGALEPTNKLFAA